MIEVYEFDNPYFEDISSLFASSYTRPAEKSPEENLRASRSRTRNRIKRLISANVDAWGCMPILITYTFKENVTDLTEANKRFRLYTQRLHRYLDGLGYSPAKYISIVEFQQRGAVHYHVVYFNLAFIPDIKSVLASLWGQGFIQVKAVENIRNMGNYLVKYLQKTATDSRLVGKKAYSTAKHLKKPQISTYPQTFSQDGLRDSLSLDTLDLQKDLIYQAGLFGQIHYKKFIGK